MEKCVDLLVALLAYLAGRRGASCGEDQDALLRDDEAARARDRLAADAAYARRVRERFRRR